VIRFSDKVHSPLTRWYTLIALLGPVRIGDSSGTKTVLLLHPVTNALTATSKSVPVRISINRTVASLDSTVQPRDKGKRDLRDDAFEHGAFSEYQSS
jgi:hypothetical protein